MIVREPGTQCSFGPSDAKISGLITGVAIYISGEILYKVCYWDGKTRKEEWLYGEELSGAPDVKMMQIGFSAPAQ